MATATKQSRHRAIEQTAAKHYATPPVGNSPKEELVYLFLIPLTMAGIIALNIVLGWSAYW